MMAKSSSAERKALIPAGVGHDKTALVPTNPRVKAIAFRWRWSVDTVISRVEKALTSKVEQQLYLKVADVARIHPESLLKMLKVFRGEQELQAADLQQFSTGPNMVNSRFDVIVEKVDQTLSLVDKTADSADFPMSMDHAARLVEAYGEHAEEVLGQIVENLGRVQEMLGIRAASPRVIVGVAIKKLVEEVIDKSDTNPFPSTIEEMFGHLRPGEESYD